MRIAEIKMVLRDNGGRRLEIESREFSYTNHVPNRRTKEDRRSGVDRRGGLERRQGIDRRSGEIIFKKILRLENDLRERIDRRSGVERRVAFAKALTI